MIGRADRRRPTPWARRPARVAAGVGVLLLACGCGGGSTTTSPGGALGRDLDAVDRAIVAQHYAAARDAIDTLVRDAAHARADGDLDAARADRIRATAARLRAALPDTAPTTGSSPTPAPSSLAPSGSSPAATPTAPEPKDKGHDKPHGKDHGKKH